MALDIAYAYALLQVTPTASDTEMRTAWRTLARRYHPDLAKIDPEEASRRMSEINAAYDAVAHHRALKDVQPAPKSRARRRSRTAREAAECLAWRGLRDVQARKAAKAWQAAQATKVAQPAPQLAEPKPRQIALKTTAKWNRAEQSLINTARAAFEGTRKTLSTAATRPVLSACH